MWVSTLFSELSRLRPGDRGNPVKVCRAISALVNSAGGDGGVIEGRWSEPYSRGTSPWDWNGSVAILKEYMEGEGRQPVRYGQCWVFSAVVVTGTEMLRMIYFKSITIHERNEKEEISVDVEGRGIF